jgi:hypothetical protein
MKILDEIIKENEVLREHIDFLRLQIKERDEKIKIIEKMIYDYTETLNKNRLPNLLNSYSLN